MGLGVRKDTLDLLQQRFNPGLSHEKHVLSTVDDKTNSDEA